MIFEGAFKLDGVEYECIVVDGVRYVNGLSIDDFIDTLPATALVELIKLGKAIKEDNYSWSSQQFINESRQSKLKDSDITFIRLAFLNKTHSSKQLSEMFNVCIPHLHLIKNRKFWKHVL